IINWISTGFLRSMSKGVVKFEWFLFFILAWPLELIIENVVFNDLNDFWKTWKDRLSVCFSWLWIIIWISPSTPRNVSKGVAKLEWCFIFPLAWLLEWIIENVVKSSLKDFWKTWTDRLSVWFSWLW
ncbi:hypothetical protein QYM36_018355, partial [Artemia franciscana]